MTFYYRPVGSRPGPHSSSGERTYSELWYMVDDRGVWVLRSNKSDEQSSEFRHEAELLKYGCIQVDAYKSKTPSDYTMDIGL